MAVIERRRNEVCSIPHHRKGIDRRNSGQQIHIYRCHVRKREWSVPTRLSVRDIVSKIWPYGYSRSPGRTRRAWGYRWLPSLWSSRILLQCAAAAPRPRCRRPVVTVRVDRRQRGGPFIAGCAGGYARTTPRHAWACGAGRGLRTRPLGGRRAAARHLGSSSAGMQPGAPRASSARSPSFPSLGNGRQR